MKGRQAAIVLGAFLGALGTQGLSAGDDDRAVPRGGGSSGGGQRSSGGSSGGSSSSAGASHHRGSSSGGSSYSGSSQRGSSARAPRTEAQRRHPQPGTGTGYRNHGRYYGGSRYYGGYYRPYSYWPYDNYYWGYGYFSPWYYPRYSGFYGGGYYGGGYGGYGYGGYGYHRGYYDRSGSVRVMVEPNETKVSVDGYYAGTADDFDGLFQRLNLTPGRHDIALNLEGFETHRVKLYVPLDHTIKIKHKMVRGAADRVSESTVGDPADEARYARRADDDEDDDRPEMDDDRDRRPQDRYEPQDRSDTRRDDSWPASRERGTLRLAVSPADASIYVDGMFRGTGDDLRRLSLPEGRHRLEVVRPGYRTIERDVEVQAGETEEVEVDLPRS